MSCVDAVDKEVDTYDLVFTSLRVGYITYKNWSIQKHLSEWFRVGQRSEGIETSAPEKHVEVVDYRLLTWKY